MATVPGWVVGVACGGGAVLVGVVIVVVYVVYRRRHGNRRQCSVSRDGYEAVGDYKPTSFLSISSQEVSVGREARPVQPRPHSTSVSTSGSAGSRTSSLRSEARSEPITVTDDTSSISARSDTSVDSLVFDASFGAIRPDLYPRKDLVLQQSSLDGSVQGRLHIRLKYDFRTSDLVVHMIEAQDISSGEATAGGLCGDPYVRLALVPPVDERVRQSSVKRRTTQPYYNEYFKFPVAWDDLAGRVLALHVCHYDRFSRHSPVGHVTVDLSQVDVTNSVEMWCDVQPLAKTSCEFGEVLLSLSYLPTAERLTLVVMKAKDLTVLHHSASADPFVRATLLVSGRKVKRKKTSVRRGCLEPVWNEALAFNVPAELLPRVALEVCVMDHDLIGHGEVIGRCHLGPGLHGTGGSHWEDMLANQRKATAMWHTLTK